MDSVYHHVLAWQEALEQDGIHLSVWRIHRKIGMSGGLLANAMLRETGRDGDPGGLGASAAAARRDVRAAVSTGPAAPRRASRC